MAFSAYIYYLHSSYIGVADLVAQNLEDAAQHLVVGAANLFAPRQKPSEEPPGVQTFKW
jgi:hypothetical protein